jgi:hypothetical protein
LTLTEKENRFMEELFTNSRKRNRTSGKEYLSKTPTKEATTTGYYGRQYFSKIVGSHQVSSLVGRHKKKMLNDLRILGLLNNVIGLNVIGRVRKYEAGANPAVKVYDIVPKGNDIYTLVFTQWAVCCFTPLT